MKLVLNENALMFHDDCPSLTDHEYSYSLYICLSLYASVHRAYMQIVTKYIHFIVIDTLYEKRSLLDRFETMTRITLIIGNFIKILEVCIINWSTGISCVCLCWQVIVAERRSKACILWVCSYIGTFNLHLRKI